MMSRITLPTNCVKHLTIMGWVSHAAGVLSMAIALATDHWLRRLSNGNHVGIFPCCPSFKCDNKVIPENDKNIGAFTDIIIVGVLLVGLGLVLSLTHACVSWRNDKRSLYGLSYCASGLVTAGGFTLVGGSIDFVRNVPGNMEHALTVECDELDIVQTGFSYALFVTGAVAFILAGIMLFVSSCRQSNPSMLTRRPLRPSIVVSESNMCLETVSAHLESQGRLSPMLYHVSELFNNPIYDIEVEEQHISTVMRRLSPHASPRQCDRLSVHASVHQSGRLSPRHQRNRLSPRASPHPDGRLSPFDQHDRLSPHASPHHGGRLSPHHQRGRLSPHHQRDRLSPHASPHGRLSHHHRDRLSLHVSPHQYDILSLHHHRDRQSPHHEHDDFPPLTSPPSYESLHELFLLNTSDDSELPERRETTEPQDLHNNSAESAGQLPTYEDVLKTHPPPYKETTQADI